MLKRTMAVLILAGASASALAQDVTWRKDVGPIVAARCAMCHGANAPEFNDWMLLGDDKRKTVAPRMDTYPHFMSYVLWPATGAMMRRLDDGKSAGAGGKPGNMYQYLGGSDEERAKNLQTIRAWLGDGAWNLNRWNARGDVPGVTKEQLSAIKAKY
jgi:hypothetical protein